MKREPSSDNHELGLDGSIDTPNDSTPKALNTDLDTEQGALSLLALAMGDGSYGSSATKTASQRSVAQLLPSPMTPEGPKNYRSPLSSSDSGSSSSPLTGKKRKMELRAFSTRHTRTRKPHPKEEAVQSIEKLGVDNEACPDTIDENATASETSSTPKAGPQSGTDSKTWSLGISNELNVSDSTVIESIEKISKTTGKAFSFAKTVRDTPRKRAPARGFDYIEGRPIPSNWHEADKADKQLWQMKNAGKDWASIRQMWFQSTGQDTAASYDHSLSVLAPSSPSPPFAAHTHFSPHEQPHKLTGTRFDLLQHTPKPLQPP